MPTHVLIDSSSKLFQESFEIRAEDLGLRAVPAWSIQKRRLHGGKSDGVDVVVIDNGQLSFTVIPTRGMGIHSARFNDTRIGWQSPIMDGPVHPGFVELAARGGLGWLKGFDELLARCGLESNGPPVHDEQGRLVAGLHGRIANIPAHHVALRVADEPPHQITLEGSVDETELFFGRLRLQTTISTLPGSNKITISDHVINLSDVSASFQLLYHWNFGPPHLDEGARFVAPVKTVCPRDARAAEGIGLHDVYGPPEPGFAEQVYYYTLHGSAGGSTIVLLRNHAGDKGVALHFDMRQLPCFTLWKSTRGLKEGYVTGLEPGVNYPNARGFEAARGRVRTLAPGASFSAETTLEVLDQPADVTALEREIAALQLMGEPRVLARPAEPFAPGI